MHVTFVAGFIDAHENTTDTMATITLFLALRKRLTRGTAEMEGL